MSLKHWDDLEISDLACIGYGSTLGPCKKRYEEWIFGWVNSIDPPITYIRNKNGKVTRSCNSPSQIKLGHISGAYPDQSQNPHGPHANSNGKPEYLLLNESYGEFIQKKKDFVFDVGLYEKNHIDVICHNIKAKMPSPLPYIPADNMKPGEVILLGFFRSYNPKKPLENSITYRFGVLRKPIDPELFKIGHCEFELAREFTKEYDSKAEQIEIKMLRFLNIRQDKIFLFERFGENFFEQICGSSGYVIKYDK